MAVYALASQPLDSELGRRCEFRPVINPEGLCDQCTAGNPSSQVVVQTLRTWQQKVPVNCEHLPNCEASAQRRECVIPCGCRLCHRVGYIILRTLTNQVTSPLDGLWLAMHFHS